MALVLHAKEENKNAFKALIAAEYVGVHVQLVDNFEYHITNRTPEFLKMNPIGKAPVLETPEGPIFESNAIARYVTRLKPNSLYGSSLIEYGQIEQWIDFSSLEIDPNLLAWFAPRMGYSVYLPPAEDAAISALKRALGALNTYLASNTYLVGHAVTLADIIGEVTQTNYVLQVSSAKKLAQPKEAAKPKPKEEPKKKEEVKPEEEEEAPKPKPKNPLDLLPPSKIGRGSTLIPRLTSVKLLSKVFGTCMILRDTHCGFATTSTTTRTLSHL